MGRRRRKEEWAHTGIDGEVNGEEGENSEPNGKDIVLWGICARGYGDAGREKEERVEDVRERNLVRKIRRQRGE